ncbi:hypothetical protein [Chromobacterium fluminis]|uniref:hypothetical protein n=1 Tax=Chromobacterium fluminis TaxID=3044269 RepID=UPI00140BD18B|nr:hypothetical protein [Chromobacterium haemolyticum]
MTISKIDIINLSLVPHFLTFWIKFLFQYKNIRNILSRLAVEQALNEEPPHRAAEASGIGHLSRSEQPSGRR